MTPQPPGVPQHIQIELARRELKSLKDQQSVAEYGVSLLTNVAAEVGLVDRAHETNATNLMLSALVALVSLRLQELENSHKQLESRITELEGALKQVDSGIVIPGLQIKH